MKTTSLLFGLILLLSCENGQTISAQQASPIDTLPIPTFLPEGKTIEERFLPPEGYLRAESPAGSFAHFLRKLPLKKDGTQVFYFDGNPKRRKDVHAAVIDLDVGSRDLQQCADAVMRLRGEYLFAKKDYDNLHFNFTNGFRAEYSKWRAGQRIKVDGNKVNWTGAGRTDTSYASFRKYMDMVFAYAGTLSLEKELTPTTIDSIQIGDIFIQGGSPGHAIIVVDMAEHPETGDRLFMLAQSYMPAQDMHILNNPRNKQFSPWYSNRFPGRLVTPEWMFEKDNLKRFKP